MEVAYLVTWQIGDNEQSYSGTPIDINVHEHDDAKRIYNNIKSELQMKTGIDNVRILGVFKLN